MIQRGRLLWLVLVLLLIDENLGHVALTFPRARKYDLDFLDSSRTPGPCGMPRGLFIIIYHLYTYLHASLIAQKLFLIPQMAGTNDTFDT